MAYEGEALFTLPFKFSLCIQSPSLHVLLNRTASVLISVIQITLHFPHSLLVKSIGLLVSPYIENFDRTVFKSTDNIVRLFRDANRGELPESVLHLVHSNAWKLLFAQFCFVQ